MITDQDKYFTNLAAMILKALDTTPEAALEYAYLVGDTPVFGTRGELLIIDWKDGEIIDVVPKTQASKFFGS